MADLTFLMNVDPPGDPNPFYSLAKQFFVAVGSDVVDAPAGGQTLEGVFNDLTSRTDVPATINLVSRASGFASMECPVTLASQAAGRRTMTVDDLQDALAAKSLAPPGPAAVTDKTRIVIYGCDVGRSESFLRMLSGLFGDPGEVLAPRRLGVFTLDGTTVNYRQAQTWSLVRQPPLILDSAAAPAGGWPNYRTTFVDDASLKFGRVAIPDEPVGTDRLKDMLTNAAANATTTFGPTFFFEAGIQIFPQGPQSAAEAAASLASRSNGDPVTALATSALDLDDTTVVTAISGTDAYAADPEKTQFAITVAVLAQIIDQDVLIAEGQGYRRLTASKGLAPSPGPKPVGGGAGSGGGGSGAGAVSAALQAAIDELLADGAAQADIDALLASLPQGDATEGLATEVPEPDGPWATEGSDYSDPALEEPA